MSKKIIGIVGFKGSGKDTVGKILQKEYQFITTSFAKSLKQALCAMFGWKPHMLEGKTPSSRKWREQPDVWWSQAMDQEVTPRKIMQKFGTGIVRKRLHNRFWVLRLQRELEQMNGNVVVTDVRFPDEIQMIRDQGGVILRVRRGPDPSWYNQAAWFNKQPGWVRPMLLWFLPNLNYIHESERNWIGYPVDHTIENSGTLEELEQQVHDFVKPLLER